MTSKQKKGGMKQGWQGKDEEESASVSTVLLFEEPSFQATERKWKSNHVIREGRDEYAQLDQYIHMPLLH